MQIIQAIINDTTRSIEDRGDILTRYLENTRHQEVRSQAVGRREGSLRYGTFSWAGSPEGFDYWNEIFEVLVFQDLQEMPLPVLTPLEELQLAVGDTFIGYLNTGDRGTFTVLKDDGSNQPHVRVHELFCDDKPEVVGMKLWADLTKRVTPIILRDEQ